MQINGEIPASINCDDLEVKMLHGVNKVLNKLLISANYVTLMSIILTVIIICNYCYYAIISDYKHDT